MNIAILGASSQIAKDLIDSFNRSTDYACDLFVREKLYHQTWLHSLNNKHYQLKTYDQFSSSVHYDVLINFVGVGDPAKAKAMGSEIFDITHRYDSLALDYIKGNKSCRYIFLSSGAIYGGSFDNPVTNETIASVNINQLQPTDWYAVAKLHAEARHRAMQESSIVDLRVFNYFSHTQDMSARFLMTDILRAIQHKEILQTSSVNIVRDYITPPDFYQLIQRIIDADNLNTALDCYTQAPIDKIELLESCANNFGLKYEVADQAGVNATGMKINYYSLNRVAESIDYSPVYSSLDGILAEIEKVVAV